ncbi:hypothetical protein EDB87DRAFT_1686022 [Lactarius vividus]|nr:hypothetical protein EDB87DRAFT_1686022 [Lactarius vividus]
MVDQPTVTYPPGTTCHLVFEYLNSRTARPTHCYYIVDNLEWEYIRKVPCPPPGIPIEETLYTYRDSTGTYWPHPARLSQASVRGRRYRGDVRAFLTSVRYKREELAAAGVTISHRDYQRTVLRGIPEELARFAANLLSAARLVHSVTTVDVTLPQRLARLELRFNDPVEYYQGNPQYAP